ncbi:serine hydrolase domain-containing protein [Brevibacillus brevis]|uniref:serine hydrolase domain-containing protein n=1 Tax=Brevibacillus brevis TaxID=1393 RepID=UPI000D0FFF08|nr:serine hydrolase domain-containing protein [Brevibacillus brevis]PSJ68129.1 penicillin-binding protein [Brevibacillus brevis]RED35613.1 CubicO group peptidase (beta-lactamase class C family) [Brevibacillus brevis]GEC87713.1 penicillin-binding protein 4* [Brevibacillus brevis]VEF89276.1 Penicillin-binding protein E [Brevibacillus brevis]
MTQRANVSDTRHRQLDELFTTIAEQNNWSGNILILEEGKPFYQNSIGMANLETAERLSPHSVFELASVSKAFTAMGIMILQEQGKLNYTDKVDSFFPDFPYADITVENLLVHTSGLPDYMELFSQYWDKSKIATNQDILEQLIKHRPNVLFLPNEKYEYSNTGYALLASIVEHVADTPFADFLQQNIFQPLDMQHTKVYNRRYSPELTKHYAYGYVKSAQSDAFVLPDESSEHDFVIYLDGIQGDGAVSSTLDDLRKWDRALYTEKLVKKATLERAFSPIQLTDDSLSHYGYGWRLREDQVTGKVVHHGGSWPGYRSWLRRYIETDKTIIYVTNVDQEREWTEKVVEAVENILFEQPYVMP